MDLIKLRTALETTNLTLEQKMKISKWSEAVKKVSDEKLKEEGPAWIEAFLNILNKTKAENNNGKKV